VKPGKLNGAQPQGAVSGMKSKNTGVWAYFGGLYAKDQDLAVIPVSEDRHYCKLCIESFLAGVPGGQPSRTSALSVGNYKLST
jgi:hypothetical protein